MLELNDLAPDFSLPCTDGSDISLISLPARPIVLFFYPRDNTPGCTTEAKEFSELAGEFKNAGISVFGISKDPLAMHQKFRDKHDLAIQLLSDEASDTCEKFGVWKEKSMYGKKFFGIERTTFLINTDKKIARVWNKVKVNGHAAIVLETASQI